MLGYVLMLVTVKKPLFRVSIIIDFFSGDFRPPHPHPSPTKINSLSSSLPSNLLLGMQYDHVVLFYNQDVAADDAFMDLFS